MNYARSAGFFAHTQQRLRRNSRFNTQFTPFDAANAQDCAPACVNC
jgi:hypothetical protein